MWFVASGLSPVVTGIFSSHDFLGEPPRLGILRFELLFMIPPG